jgi:hypothetical protein
MTPPPDRQPAALQEEIQRAGSATRRLRLGPIAVFALLPVAFLTGSGPLTGYCRV